MKSQENSKQTSSAEYTATNTINDNTKGIFKDYDYSEYSGYWEDSEFVKHEFISHTIRLNFKSGGHEAEIHIWLINYGNILFETSCKVTFNDNAEGDFEFEDNVFGIKGNGKIILQSDGVQVRLTPQISGNETSVEWTDIEKEILNDIKNVYCTEKTLIRNQYENIDLPDAYEVLAEAIGLKESNEIIFSINAEQTEGYKSWVSIISVFKGGKHFKTYKVNTLERTVEEYDLGEGYYKD